MNYDQRMNEIKAQLAELLSGYAAPRNLIDPASQQKEVLSMAEAINQIFPNDTTRDHICGTLKRASLKLKAKHKSRTWPLTSDIVASVTKSMQHNAVSQKLNNDDVEAAARFLGETGRAHPNYRSSYVAKRLIDRGLLKDERDAHWRGFDMFEYKNLYSKQRMTLDEWNNHIRVLSDMCNITKEEAENRELFGHGATLGPIGVDIIPEEMLQRLRQSGM